MTVLSIIIREGSRYYDPHADAEFEVIDAPEPGSRDFAVVTVKYDDGTTAGHPFDFFGPGSDFEKVADADDRHPDNV